MHTLRIGLFNQNNADDGAFRQPFEEEPHLHLVGEYSAWLGLQECLLDGTVDVVAVNLDAAEQAAIAAVQRIVEAAPGITVIGVSSKGDPESIIHAMRSGCAQYVRWPIDQADLQSALDRVRKSRTPANAASRRICVIGSSGGVGATTIACNLAIELAHVGGRRVGLVDLNLEYGDVACMFDAKPKHTLVDLCREGVEIDRMMLEEAIEDLPCNVSVLGRPERLEEARDITPEGVEAVLRLMGQIYPFVIVDLPRSFSFMSAAALSQVEHALIVTQLGVPFLRNATRIHECLRQMGTSDEKIEIILNRSNASFERLTVDDVAKHFGKPVFGVIPNDYRRVTASRDLGHPMLTDAPNSPARMAIQQVASTLAARHLGEDAVKKEPARSGISKLWGRK